MKSSVLSLDCFEDWPIFKIISFSLQTVQASVPLTRQYSSWQSPASSVSGSPRANYLPVASGEPLFEELFGLIILAGVLDH